MADRRRRSYPARGGGRIFAGGIPTLGVVQSGVDSWMLYARSYCHGQRCTSSCTTWVSLEVERRKAVRFQSSAQAARLRALQAQLEPHFIFNTLNSISSLVVEGRSEAATAMIAKLSDFLRLTLQTSGTPEILLANELVFVRKYLEIQQLRFGDRLRYLNNIEPGAANAMVPQALLLQPLVENAVRHGILARATGGLVKVTACALDGTLFIEVDDDGLGMRKSSGLSFGLGLSSIATRLNEHYGDESQFHVGRSAAGGVAVSIRIPLHFEPRIRNIQSTRGDRIVKIRALVDDEELARRGLRTRLERTADVTVIGECTNGLRRWSLFASLLLISFSRRQDA